VSATTESVAKTKLFCDLLSDSLEAYAYDAEIAGLDYRVSGHSAGIDLEVSGYNDKLPVLLEKVLDRIRNLEIQDDRFYIIKERMQRDLRNWGFSMPYSQVIEYARLLLSEKGFTNDEISEGVSRVNAEDVRRFFPDILRQAHIETLTHGNLYREDALKLTNLVSSIIKLETLPQSQWSIRRSPILPQGSSFVFNRQLPDPKNVNHSIEYFLYVGDKMNQELRAKLFLLAQLTDEPGFDQLRTKEQLGYVVFTGPRLTQTTMGYRVIIQSEKTPEHLEERIDSFLNAFGKSLQEMSESEFEGHKRSLYRRLVEKLKNLGQETTRFWTHIGSDYYSFDQSKPSFHPKIGQVCTSHQMSLLILCNSDQVTASHVTKLTKPDIITFFNYYIHPSSPHRAKLSVRLLAQATSPPSSNGTSTTTSEPSSNRATPAPSLAPTSELFENGICATPPPAVVPSAVVIEDVRDFRASLALTPGARPVRDLSEFEELGPKL
jgi:insulysin